MNKQLSYKILTYFLGVQIITIYLLSKFPAIIETYYSNGIYQYIAFFFRKGLGWIPFSVGDIYYFLLGLFLIFSFYKLIKSGFKKLKENAFKLGAIISVFYFLFHFFWGLNYHKDSLFNTLQLEQKEYTLEDLELLTEDLLKKATETHAELVVNDTLKINLLTEIDTILQRTEIGYRSLSKVFPQFKYQQTSIKKSLFSTPLTYMGFSGYFNPISGEAQVDYLVPRINLPMISSHEVAHQLGFASESEANFIGFLAATHHEDPSFRFSGYSAALRYAILAVYGKDSITGKQIIDSLPKGMVKTFRESQEFWKTYQNKAEPYFKLFYDNYLKANQQKDGMKGYSQMVGLLVAYREKYGIQ